MKRRSIEKIRKLYLISSILVGILSPLTCLYLFPDFDPKKYPISYFGIFKDTSLIFLISLVIFSIAIFWNGITIIRKLIKQKKYHFILKALLITASVCLFITGIIPMDFKLLHQIPALFFFLIYNFFIFMFGITRSLSYVRKGLFSVLTGSVMLLSFLFQATVLQN